MAKYISKAKGINAALDLVEEALITLQERAEKQPASVRSNSGSHHIRTSPPASTSDIPQDPTRNTVKPTAVLIKRPSRSRSRNFRNENRKLNKIKRNKTEKRQDISIQGSENSKNTINKQTYEQNMSSDSDDTPRKSRKYIPHRKLRSRNKELNKNSIENLPHESTRCTEIERSHPNPRYSPKISKMLGNKERYRIIDTSEEEQLPGRENRSTVRSVSRSSHSKHSQRKGTSEDEESDSVTSHREPRRRNQQKVLASSQDANTIVKISESRSQRRDVPADKQTKKRNYGYAEPTLTSRLRKELKEPRESEGKENLIPFIPSGTKNKSFHVGVIIQKELGKLKNIPPKELESIMSTGKSRHDSKASTSGLSEEVVKIAMHNIQKEITVVSKRISKQ